MERSIDMAIDRHIPIFVVGVGTLAGGRMPPFLGPDGEPIRDPETPLFSQLEREALQEIATTAGGQYFELDRDTLGTYERIRKRLGGLAFVPAHRERCMACKMVIPHQIYVVLRKGDDIPACESCGRMLYWSGHFPDDQKASDEPAPKASPPARRHSHD